MDKDKLVLVAEGKIIKLSIDSREGDLRIRQVEEFNEWKFNKKGKTELTTQNNYRIWVEEI